jgi:DNA repair exonuclease SbcCD ATPase subunit
LLETIKALYQEYEELDAGHSKLFKDFCGMKQEMTELRAELETTKHIATAQTEAAIDYQQENQQLQERNGAYREALEPVRKDYEDGTYAMICPICHCLLDENESNHAQNCKAYKALSATPADCHNPADVEALAKAREALGPLLKLAVLVNNEKYKKGEFEGADVAMGWVDKAKEALAAIDKVVGE